MHIGDEMDIKKEREAFEAALISKRIFDKADIENYVVFFMLTRINTSLQQHVPRMRCLQLNG